MMPLGCARRRRAIRVALASLSCAVAVACAQAPMTGAISSSWCRVPGCGNGPAGIPADQAGGEGLGRCRTEPAGPDSGEAYRRSQRPSRVGLQFTLFDNAEPNAFALPGGKVGVYTGLFKVAKNDAQLAAVMGHEVGHAIARHGAERMSHGILTQLGGVAVGAATGSQAYVDLYSQAATLGVILPYSRGQESEADEIGLMLMAEAGYDPREAVKLWQNFEALSGERPPEFLSTHPAEGTRIERLQALMPERSRSMRPTASREPMPRGALKWRRIRPPRANVWTSRAVWGRIAR